ncbi:hypothetical protein A2671_02550 [Candidatus Kaiserbacteria bacterium RIFCSPHIGHO2_01_FULL_49_13]|uniref:Uncharacterized protein n=1 Tax=Candidatus Kaiserbacteria bacterium RIFCSPHIGHO2_01_FULL_49_13 TaxID=1798477 RepID=A0A1F6CDA6_9BACT|nr:MAG: hypothetical protein A2671_02550 [Candidatus Kaiserbacteria bacterium RIFCSPHIGHO2_01_FULL_49_13]
MPTQKPSRYAKRLIELGFRRLSPEEDAYMDRRIERRLAQLRGPISRRERRAIAKMRKELQFNIVLEKTFAIDDTGQRWTADKPIDLTSLGFENDTVLAALVQFMPPLEPTKDH